MKRSIKKKIEYTFPNVINDFIRKYRLKISNVDITMLLKKNKIWHNHFLNERVFIIANGPSVNEIDQSIFFGEKVIVMNNFNRCVWKNDVEIVAHCIGEPCGLKSWIYSNIDDNINGTNSLSYWLHFSSKEHFKDHKKSPYINYVFPISESGIWGDRQFLLHKGTMGYQTTAQLAIQVAMYMGFSKVYLIGFDHDWLASPNFSRHFYSDIKDQEDTLNEMSYIEIIEMMKRMWDLYYKMNTVATKNQVRIVNLNTNSYLDVFERKDVTSLF